MWPEAIRVAAGLDEEDTELSASLSAVEAAQD